MPVCHKRKLAFCHIPRTGGVSVSNALQLEVNDYHYPASWYRENYPDYYLFTIYRPYTDRRDSAMANIDKQKRNLTLMLKPNEYFIDAGMDTILDFYNLEESLNRMLSKLKLPEVKLIKCNSFK